MKKILIILCVLMGHVCMKAQEQRPVTGTLWQNWFVQAGLDMSLQNPYQCNFSEVSPKGKTFGGCGFGKMVYASCCLAR